MPTYEFECQECEHKFSLIRSISEHEKEKVACPECKKENVKQVISAFMVKTARKS